MDPQLATQPIGFAMIRATQRGLTAFPPAVEGGGVDPATPVADLSEAPSVSADGKMYTFHLRPGVAFGPPANRPLEARDVKAGIERIFRIGSPLRRYFRVIAGAAEMESRTATGIAGIQVPDARTVRIKLLRPTNDLLWMLAHPVASAVPAGTPVGLKPDALSSSGPYRVAAVTPGHEIRLVRNDAWNQSSDPVRNAYVDQIRVQVGTASGADITDESLPAPTGSHAARVDPGCLLYLFLNGKAPKLADGRVRAGIAVAIDRQSVLTALHAAGGPDGTAVNAILPAGAVGFSDRPVPAADAARARGLIKTPFSVVLGRETDGPDAAADQAAAAALTTQLAAVGVRALRAGAPPVGSVYDRYAAGEIPMGLARWCADWPGRAGRTMLGALGSPSGPADYARIADPPFEGAMAAALTAGPGGPVAGPVAAAWKRAEDRLLAIGSIIPIGFLSQDVPLSTRVRGFVGHPLFVLGDPTTVWLA